MKVLSIQQPWAYAILYLGKNIENRTWSTVFRGRFLIHAGKKLDIAAYNWFESNGLEIPLFANGDTGGIVGSVDLVDCVKTSESFWFCGPFGFVLRDPEVREFEPCRGQLGFFERGNIYGRV
jgi:hypothetical protein